MVAISLGRATFHLDSSLKVIEVVPDAPISDEELRHLLIDQLGPAILAETAHLVLHASAIATPAGVIGFLAPSGFGKSTLATNLARRFATHVGDDALVIDKRPGGLFARGLKGLIRMRPDVAPTDARIEAKAFGKHCMTVDDLGLSSAGEDWLPLKRIYLLQPPDAERIAVESLPAKDAFFVLLDQQFRLFKDDPARQALEFERTSDPALLSLCRKLIYPRRLDVFDDVWNTLSSDLSQTF